MSTGTNSQSRGGIAEIYCPTCGAPVAYDIRRAQYTCTYCGGSLAVSEAVRQKQGFRRLHQKKIKESSRRYRLTRAACTGCGAEIVFEENEPMASCAFCGRALIRKAYLSDKDLPELVIPFRLTKNEARERLEAWCGDNPGKSEARALTEKAGALSACYLPYELVRGPVACSVRRIDGGRRYHCGGFIDEVFVNCSKSLDNRLLDAMEPYDLTDLTAFDFAYVAGHPVKTADVTGGELESRVATEVREAYAPEVRKVLETKAIEVDTDVSGLLRMPVLLPAYYFSDGKIMAAVNGQTGKVSVRAVRDSFYYFIPWWLKAILSTILISAIAYLSFSLAGMSGESGLLIAGMLGLVTLIVTLAAFSDMERTGFRIKREKKIFTSAGGPFVRRMGELVQDKDPLTRHSLPPVFFENLNGRRQEVVLRFSTPYRMIRMLVLAAVVLFLPVIIAFFLTGFDASKIQLGGSAVWFCIFVPVVPIYLLKFGRIDLYDRPWIYLVTENGKKKRWRDTEARKELLKLILGAYFSWPSAMAAWGGTLFGLLCFMVIVLLTAGAL